MAVTSMKSLLEAGVHFGHKTGRWNPKMRSFIFTERNSVHIIDLQQTMTRLEKAYDVVRETVTRGGVVLFVGTKKQAQEIIATEATRAAMPYVSQRWLGGTLTNFQTIRKRIDYLLNLETRKQMGDLERLIKKEQLVLQREMDRLNIRLGGIKTLSKAPDMLFIVDTRREELAVKEARALKIPIVAMVDTNSDPDPIDYAIPANDDAIRAVQLLTSKMADACIEGNQLRAAAAAERDREAEAKATAVHVFEPDADEEAEPSADSMAEPVAGEAYVHGQVFEPDPEDVADDL
ncbi:MAG: 30S ribosomal protein S2 [Chloroflexi bacterium]|nr:30S ribosomal protein S2 [Chloroflexota bacterium]